MTEEIIHKVCNQRIEDCTCKNPRVSIISQPTGRDVLAAPFTFLTAALKLCSLMPALIAVYVGGRWTAEKVCALYGTEFKNVGQSKLN